MGNGGISCQLQRQLGVCCRVWIGSTFLPISDPNLWMCPRFIFSKNADLLLLNDCIFLSQESCVSFYYEEEKKYVCNPRSVQFLIPITCKKDYLAYTLDPKVYIIHDPLLNDCIAICDRERRLTACLHKLKMSAKILSLLFYI